MKVFERDVRDISGVLDSAKESAQFAEGCSSEGLENQTLNQFEARILYLNPCSKYSWSMVVPESRKTRRNFMDTGPNLQWLEHNEYFKNEIIFRWVEFAWKCRKSCDACMVWNWTRYSWFYSEESVEIGHFKNFRHIKISSREYISLQKLFSNIPWRAFISTSVNC